uniref:Uncharacterized protein n=1 Tax=Arundo donax TaxID=35708 RepID=A0A0A8XRX4_ARUDO
MHRLNCLHDSSASNRDTNSTCGSKVANGSKKSRTVPLPLMYPYFHNEFGMGILV